MLLAGVAGNAAAMQMDLRGSRSFDSQRSVIERDLADGEKYAELTAEDRMRVKASLDRMQRLIEQSGPVVQMQPDEQVELFNEQETVNQILTAAAEDSRLVCRREQRTGSRFVTSSCMTVAERRRQREASVESLPAGNVTPESVLRDRSM
ncbi:hypothetical protein [Marilutibacter chinensis]|uniref:Uncharacterized protein n=1 Tax=Marilutibacter chinensis TaxID=2912247 RepID=A0ABS9HWZ2_9GAMM|nr:hypothetical protein [Lysobacter chinensis]MCF7223401.1 hypothetical protein [Lysobacter chinensis]